MRAVACSILILIAAICFISAGSEACFKVIRSHACESTYSQTEDFVECESMKLEEFVKKVRVTE